MSIVSQKVDARNEIGWTGFVRWANKWLVNSATGWILAPIWATPEAFTTDVSDVQGQFPVVYNTDRMPYAAVSNTQYYYDNTVVGWTITTTATPISLGKGVVSEEGGYILLWLAQPTLEIAEWTIQFENGTLVVNQVYPVRSDAVMPATDTFHYIWIQTWYTAVSFLNYQITIHDDTRIATDTSIIFEFGTLAWAVFTPIAGSQATIAFADIIAGTTVSHKDVVLPLTVLNNHTKFCYRFTQLTGNAAKDILLSAEVKMFWTYQ